MASRADQFFADLKAHLHAFPSKTMEASGMKLKEAAVLAPLFWRDDQPWAYLTQRPDTLRNHPGQISFPGGGREPGDVTPLHTALRETREELGIPTEAVDVLGMLGSMPTVTSYWVTPFVGVIDASVKLVPSAGEIETVLEAPLFQLRTEQRQIFSAPRDAFVWAEGEHAVWGATYRMLRQLMDHVDAVK